MSHSSKFLEMVNECKKKIKALNVDQVSEKLQKRENFYLVDTREDNEWEMGHIKDAIHIGKGVIERDIERLIPDKSAEIVTMARQGIILCVVTRLRRKYIFRKKCFWE